MCMGIIKTSLAVLAVTASLYIATKSGSCSCMMNCADAPEPVKRKAEYVSRQYTHTVESAIDTIVEAVDQVRNNQYDR